MIGFSSRLDRALSLIAEKGLGGLIIYSPGTVNLQRPSYLYYFAGYRPFGPHNALVISGSGDVALLVEPAWIAGWSAEKSMISNTIGSTDFVNDLAGLIKRMGLTGPVGLVDTREMTEDIYLGIRNVVSVQPADDIVEEIARVKTPEEIDNVYKVGKIADAGFRAFIEYSRVGMREYELAAEIDYAMRQAGAEDNFILLGSEKHNLAMHYPRDKRLTRGAIVLGEITPVLNGQFIQLCRTVVLGKPGDLLKQKYDMLLRALNESLKTVKAGAPAASISKAMNKVIGDAGYAQYCYPPYMRARGHGFGVGTVAPGGVIDDQTKGILEDQQVVIVHPNQYLPETGYLACGETYLVTATGVRPLSETKSDLYVKEA